MLWWFVWMEDFRFNPLAAVIENNKESLKNHRTVLQSQFHSPQHWKFMKRLEWVAYADINQIELKIYWQWTKMWPIHGPTIYLSTIRCYCDYSLQLLMQCTVAMWIYAFHRNMHLAHWAALLHTSSWEFRPEVIMIPSFIGDEMVICLAHSAQILFRKKKS